MENKYCSGCKTDRPIDQFYKNKARGDGLSPLCIVCHNADTAERTQRLRKQAIDLLGGKCLRCGFSDIRALQFDHVNGDGANKRRGGGASKRQGGENNHQIIKAVLNGSTDFQILCANCNWIKKHELAECVGIREYNRIIPEARIKGPGKGSAETSKAHIGSAFWSTATPEEIEARNKKISITKRNANAPNHL